MQYKAVNRSSQYLVHFNKNHDPKNGRFTFKKAWETIDTAVSKGYDAVEKVAKGAYRGIKKEFKDPSSSDFDGYSTPKISSTTSNNDKVGFPNSVITKSSNPDDYRSPDLDKDYSELEKSGVFNVGKLKNLHTSDDANQVWGKDMVNAIDIGIKALGKTGYATGDSDIEEFISGSADESHKNALRSWFVFEDQTYGYPEAAYLVNAGWPKDKIFNSFKSAYEQESKNNEFSEAYLASKKAESLSQPDLFIKLEETRNLEPYKNVWPLSEGYINGKARLSEYIDACTDVINESKVQHSIVVNCGNYLVHYNKNHSKANGQFVSGDGDGDGISDDHHNQSKFLNKDGTLTKYAKGVSGLSSIDMKPRKDVNYKKAQKLISKDVRKVEFWSGSQSLKDEATEYFAEKKLEKDIERANKDKDFMDALRKGVAKYFEIEKDDWSKAYDYEDQLLDELKKKYPQHKDVISGITIGENVYSGNYKKWLKTDNAFSDILNNDFYYEQSDLDSVSLKSIDDIISAYDKELANTMIQKYGSYNVDSAWKEKVGLK